MSSRDVATMVCGENNYSYMPPLQIIMKATTTALAETSPPDCFNGEQRKDVETI